jgi:hypothetical protein
MNPKREPCFVILRTDLDSGGITVKLVLWSAEEAEDEVKRLNALNGDKDCCYHWLTSRAARRA